MCDVSRVQFPGGVVTREMFRCMMFIIKLCCTLQSYPFGNVIIMSFVYPNSRNDAEGMFSGHKIFAAEEMFDIFDLDKDDKLGE